MLHKGVRMEGYAQRGGLLSALTSSVPAAVQLSVIESPIMLLKH